MNFDWKLSETTFTKDKGTVFSCFSCGGGSSLGYKLAGFDVIGCNEIDKRMFDVYCKNNNPKFAFNEPIQTFKTRTDIPAELYELDILDGSPPCSSFSMAGNRSEDWGKEKMFTEGQAVQVLDTLFFDFIDVAKKLQPKVVIAENVKGLLLGEAKEYVRQIYREFDVAGYYVQHFLLNASKMGVPQRRERVFFIALRKDLSKKFLKQIDLFTIAPELKLEFNEKEIKLKEILTKGQRISEKRTYSETRFGDVIVDPSKVMRTLVSRNDYFFDLEHFISKETLIKAGTFPSDFNFLKNTYRNIKYIVGMSVPPLMVARIAEQINKQWLSKL